MASLVRRSISNGKITKTGEDEFDVDIDIPKAVLPADQYLVSTVPEPQNKWLVDAGLSGKILGQGTINFHHPGKPKYSLDFDLSQANANPYNTDYAITDMSGKANLTNTQITLNEVRGKHDSAVFTTNGYANWQQKPAQINFDISANNLPVNNQTLDLIPPDAKPYQQVEALLTKFKPIGLMNAFVNISSSPDSPKLAYDIDLHPKSLAFNYNNTRLSFTDMFGNIDVGTDIMELNDVGGRFKNGNFEASGFVEYGQHKNTALNFKAQSNTIDQTTKAVLPQRVVDLISNLSLTGSYAIDNGRLVLRDDNTNSPKYEVDGDIKFTNGHMSIGVPVSNFNGNMALKIIGHRNSPWPWVDIDITADQLFVAKRLVQNFTLNMDTGDAYNQILVKNINGDIYNGKLIADGELLLGDNGDYRFDVKIHDARVDAFLEPAKYNSQILAYQKAQREGNTTVKAPAINPGTLSASLLIEQPWNKPQERRGRGIIQVRNAKLYKSPLTLAILQIANLGLPTSQSFDRVASRYVIDGDTIFLDTLSLESPGIVLNGSGLIDWPTQKLDINLYTRNPNALDLGPFTQLINAIKDEITAIHIGGTVESPNAGIVPFTGLSRSWDEAFREKQAKRRDLTIDAKQ